MHTFAYNFGALLKMLSNLWSPISKSLLDMYRFVECAVRLMYP